jgi:phage tail-like protein
MKMPKRILSFTINCINPIWRSIMSMFTVNTHRFDPYKNFKFRVQWDGKYIPGISKISPLTRMTEVVAHREGGDPSNFRLSPGTTKFEPIVMERGLSHDKEFEDWVNMTFNIKGDASISLKNYKKDIMIELLNLQGMVAMRFFVYRCWVSEYQSLPELNANDKCIAIERIVIQHEGWERDTGTGEPQET